MVEIDTYTVRLRPLHRRQRIPNQRRPLPLRVRHVAVQGVRLLHNSSPVHADLQGRVAAALRTGQGAALGHVRRVALALALPAPLEALVVRVDAVVAVARGGERCYE